MEIFQNYTWIGLYTSCRDLSQFLSIENESFEIVKNQDCHWHQCSFNLSVPDSVQSKTVWTWHLGLDELDFTKTCEGIVIDFKKIWNGCLVVKHVIMYLKHPVVKIWFYTEFCVSSLQWGASFIKVFGA